MEIEELAIITVIAIYGVYCVGANFAVNNQAPFSSNTNTNWPILHNTFSEQLTTPWPSLGSRQRNQNRQPWYLSTTIQNYPQNGQNSPTWVRPTNTQYFAQNSSSRNFPAFQPTNIQTSWQNRPQNNRNGPTQTRITPRPINTQSIPQFPASGILKDNAPQDIVTTTILDIPDNELRSFSESLFEHDINNAGRFVSINYQAKTTSRSQVDVAPLPLLTVNENAFDIPTISYLLPLHDNYILHTNITENITPGERMEEEELLRVMRKTPVMKHTEEFLRDKGIINDDFWEILNAIWFTAYPRKGGRLSSSGFEHVFLAEIKGRDLIGFHNWLYFNREELNQNVNYLGYLKILDFQNKGAILKFHMNYHGIDKPVSSMFIGTSPELEMALYTTCFLIRPDRVCPLRLAGKNFIIRTFTYNYRNKHLIGSAFPEI